MTVDAVVKVIGCKKFILKEVSSKQFHILSLRE